MRYSRRSGVSETPVGEDLFLVEMGSGELFHLDRSARGLWTLLDQPTEFAVILATFVEAFPDAAPDQLERDLHNALAGLMRRGLVVTLP